MTNNDWNIIYKEEGRRKVSTLPSDFRFSVVMTFIDQLRLEGKKVFGISSSGDFYNV